MLKKRKKSSESIKGIKLNIKFTSVILVLVMIPVAFMGSLVFYNIEQSTIRESITYMQSTMERRQDSVRNNIDSVNMTTQFFLSDETMMNVLTRAARGQNYTTKEWISIYRSDVAALERLINNNPVLYGVRFYATTDNVQEMMPVLYNQSRMQKQSWAQEKKTKGWVFNYRDNLFSSGDGTPLLALLTPVEDWKNGTIGLIEASIAMQTMFPSMYENIDHETSCFVTEDGQVIFAGEENEELKSVAKSMQENMQEKVSKGEPPEIVTNYERQQKSVISGMYIKELGGTLVLRDDISESLGEVYQMRRAFVGAMILLLIALAFAVNSLVNHLLKKFYEVLKTIREVRHGNLDVRTAEDRVDEMGELAYQVNRMLDNIQELMRENINRELLAKDSQLRALQNQINAHFIYNVLESIKMMAEMKEEYDISDAITSLGKLLRYSMKWTSENVLVSEELEYIKNYMALINLRFDYEIYLALNMSEEILAQRIPKMTLQPIIENAIIHGVEEIAEDTTIYVKGVEDEDTYSIEITDNGRGMDDAELDRLRKKISGEIPTSGGSGNGIGLKNVQDRIRMAFGNQYGIEVATKEGCYTKVCVKIPKRTEGTKEGMSAFGQV